MPVSAFFSLFKLPLAAGQCSASGYYLHPVSKWPAGRQVENCGRGGQERQQINMIWLVQIQIDLLQMLGLMLRQEECPQPSGYLKLQIVNYILYSIACISAIALPHENTLGHPFVTVSTWIAPDCLIYAKLCSRFRYL